MLMHPSHLKRLHLQIIKTKQVHDHQDTILQPPNLDPGPSALN